MGGGGESMPNRGYSGENSLSPPGTYIHSDQADVDVNFDGKPDDIYLNSGAFRSFRHDDAEIRMAAKK